MLQDGRNTIWPHDPQTGWSYCVMIPSWIVQTEPGGTHESFLNPIVVIIFLCLINFPTPLKHV